MNGQVGGVERVGGSAIGDLWARKVKAKAVGAGHHIHQSFEARLAHWPADRREVVVKPAHSQSPIEGVVGWVANGAMSEKDLLIDLLRVSIPLMGVVEDPSA